MMNPDLITILQTDYQRFPLQQTYDIYAPDVYFQDPFNRFQGVARYRQMIEWMGRWFQQIRLDLHQIEQQGDRIRTDWTLSWVMPFPWQPAITVNGWSELHINSDGLIDSHVDYWHCSRWSVIRQFFSSKSA